MTCHYAHHSTCHRTSEWSKMHRQLFLGAFDNREGHMTVEVCIAMAGKVLGYGHYPATL
ncbi:hypothetical protein SDC9_122770 [bioreactor metagenome]|uniref:Uncharacterized protein n=1 Tax=bioreactor metagenome TaxID=1076179 RepID=A0A645CFL2_9ZZZZ